MADIIITSIKMPKNCSVPVQPKNLNHKVNMIPIEEIHTKSLFFETNAYPKKPTRESAKTIS